MVPNFYCQYRGVTTYLGIGWVSSGYGVQNSIVDSLMNNNADHIVANWGFP